MRTPWRSTAPPARSSEMPVAVRDAAVAAFGCRQPGTEVLRLTADVVPWWPRRRRVLRYEGDGCTAVVGVRGYRRLVLDVRLRPDDSGEVEVLQVESIGPVRARALGRHRLVDIRPGLTSLLVRWPDRCDRAPVRTSWTLL